MARNNFLEQLKRSQVARRLGAPNNGWKNVRPRRRMVSYDKGYQGSEKKKRRPAAKYSFFGGKRWN